jgi:hypothetical protein
VQQQKDQTAFGGMFERGEIFDGEQPKSSFDDATPAAASTTHDSHPNQDDRTKQFMADYLSGFRDQSLKQRQHQPSVAPHQSSSKHTRHANSTDSDDDVESVIDTRHGRPFPMAPSTGVAPSPASLAAMYADARQNFGLDLSDPIIQEELRRIQEEHKRTGKTHSELRKEAQAAAAKGVGRISVSSSKSVPEGDTVTSDFNGGSWIGPLLFCMIIGFALRWMGLF